jgi:hypothetical protein
MPHTVHLYKEGHICMLANKVRKQVYTIEQRYLGLLRSENWYFLNDVSGKRYGPTKDCPKTLVPNYHHSLRNNLQERSFDLLHT